MKLLENHPSEALHVEPPGLDKAIGIDDEALPHTIENDIHHEVSPKFIEEAPSSKLPNQETSTETREEDKPDIPYATTSTSSAPNEASGGQTLKRDSEIVQFTPFSRFPVEIRLNIWHCTFIKRHVSLNYDHAFHFVMQGGGTYKQVVRYVPVALAVNQESRHETLEYYSFVFFEGEIDIRMFPDHDNHHLGPGWVNPFLDTIYFSEPPAVCMKDAYDSWFKHIASRIYLGDFRQLEIRHLSWDGIMKQQTEPYHENSDLWRLFQHILRFRGLNTVVLIGIGGDGPTIDQLEILRKLAVEHLEREKYSFDGCIVPVVKAKQ